MRQIDADALTEKYGDWYVEEGSEEGFIGTVKQLIDAQPEREGTRLSTVCLLCKKPAVTFNTEDDIPYTNYSYCEDCLRKGLKLLREQKKNLQVQPERKTGHWVEIGDEPYDEWECDVCGFVIDGSGCIDPEEYRDVYKFCPNCGADMRGEQE